MLTKPELPGTPIVEDKKEDREIPQYFPVVDQDGMTKFYSTLTGEEINVKIEEKKSLYEPYNAHKALVIVEAIGRGDKLTDALKEAKLTRREYSHWSRQVPEFQNALQSARESRANTVHDMFYEDYLYDVVNNPPDLDDPHANKAHRDKLNTIAKTQQILSKFKLEDNPYRYGVQYQKMQVNNDTRFEMNIQVDQKTIDLLQDKFAPVIDTSGDVVLPDQVKP